MEVNVAIVALLKVGREATLKVRALSGQRVSGGMRKKKGQKVKTDEEPLHQSRRRHLRFSDHIGFFFGALAQREMRPLHCRVLRKLQTEIFISP